MRSCPRCIGGQLLFEKDDLLGLGASRSSCLQCGYEESASPVDSLDNERERFYAEVALLLSVMLRGYRPEDGERRYRRPKNVA